MQLSERDSPCFSSSPLVSADDVLPETIHGAEYGRLSNGLTYYVRCNSDPKMRAALALVVKVGSVLEEENERGVAHIVEHLAFRATTNYANHEIVRYLDSIGANMGACQNAHTSTDETIYWFFIPIDKPKVLSQAISILGEFSSEVLVSANDLDIERGIIIEEYRTRRDADGRMHRADWDLKLDGSKYAERSPIGLENVIRTVSHKTIEKFYKKWYHLQNMAVIAVGDFPNAQMVVELIKTHFEDKISMVGPPIMPYFPVPSHEMPRFSTFLDSEASPSVTISWKFPADKVETIRDYRNVLSRSLFIRVLNQRLAKEKGTLEALESMLTEVARVRIHGFSEREMLVARSQMISEIKSAYRDGIESPVFLDHYVQHFVRKVPVIGIEHEAHLYQILLPDISAPEVSEFAKNLRTSCSCVIKIAEPQSIATVDDLKTLVLRVNSCEEELSIPPWYDEHIQKEIVSAKPTSGHVVHQFEYSSIGATEIILSNGMRVCYKCTDFRKDELAPPLGLFDSGKVEPRINPVSFTGFSYGGLSELQESEYVSRCLGPTLAREIGVFGYKRVVLDEMLAGKIAGVNTELEAYMRSFYGHCSPSHLETGLQLVYQLFMTNLEPDEEDVQRAMKWTEEFVRDQERNPSKSFENHVRELKYGGSYFFRPIKMDDLGKVDPLESCQYFNKCFKDPSTFTVVLVGNIDPAVAVPLILQYLGGIPQAAEPILNFKRDELKGLPFNFPSTIREVVQWPMVEAQCSVQLCFPLELKNANMVEDVFLVHLMRELMEKKIWDSLRSKLGEIYDVSVSVDLSVNNPSRDSVMRGDISVLFSCDPDRSSMLVDIVFEEIHQLQWTGPSTDDVSSILEIEQRDHETKLQENDYWVERICRSYQSRTYSGDVGASFKDEDEGRSSGRDTLTSSTAKSTLQRIIPFPCTDQYVLAILMPQRP